MECQTTRSRWSAPFQNITNLNEPTGYYSKKIIYIYFSSHTFFCLLFICENNTNCKAPQRHNNTSNYTYFEGVHRCSPVGRYTPNVKGGWGKIVAVNVYEESPFVHVLSPSYYSVVPHNVGTHQTMLGFVSAFQLVHSSR